MAKAEVYLHGFDKGVMMIDAKNDVCGVNGMSVRDARAKVKEYLIKQQLSVVYSEPASEVGFGVCVWGGVTLMCT